jgi:hypothetical protein
MAGQGCQVSPQIDWWSPRGSNNGDWLVEYDWNIWYGLMVKYGD